MAVSLFGVAATGAQAAARAQSDVLGPVSKVTTLLKDMQEQLEKEAEEDNDVNEKMECWCEKNDRSKTQAIGEGTSRVDELTSTIESTAAASARLTQEISNHEQDLTKSQQSLDTATALREKQAAEFAGEEKDMIQSIKALEAAIIVLSRHFSEPAATALLARGASAAGAGGSELSRDEALRHAIAVARDLVTTHRSLLQGTITPRQRRVVLALQESGGGQASNLRQGYAPQSGEIFGILKQMKETFETNLAASQKEESEALKAFEALKAAKQEEIAATSSSAEEKRVQLADAQEKNAQAKQELEDTRQMLVDDNGLLITIKEKCELSRKEFETRTNLRQEEISAITQAIAVLSSDAARDQFSKSFSPAASFLQLSASRAIPRVAPQGSSVARAARRDAAAEVLRKAASKVRSPRLAALAVSAGLDAFTKVKKAIDDMIGELKKEQADEVTHRDTCVQQLNENQLLTEREQRTTSDLQSKADGLKMTVDDLTEGIKLLQNEIADLRLQIKRRGEDRELQNRDFQATLKDHRDSEALLHKAVQVLRSVYSKAAVPAAAAPALVQSSRGAAAVDPPPSFSKYERSAGGGGVVALLEQITADVKRMQQEVIKDEQASQGDYEAFVKGTNTAISAKEQAVISKTSDKAKTEQDLGQAKQDMEASMLQQEQLANTAAALHQSCDFVTKNFDVRQQARSEEIEALQQAKAVLSGMDLDSAA
eukprot:TRINITY_DN75245_c0_g1_i1.p1 TRINITY_DN75245_c0_g1~~TRINITY_DN75245_c0_g1_i1.p1  ORF type:complete len:744 (+),score=264.14 TRINITY_DN75245_c0_g1_i1:90-2234(+)